jgi:glycosyltransferase involved in cell wall biosynthesis
VSQSLRIAIVLDPFAFRRKGGEHAPRMAHELLSRGHEVRAFGDARGDVPRSSTGPLAGDVAPLEGAGVMGFQPQVIVAYDALSPAAWHGARCARRLGVPLVLVEEGFPMRGRPIERLKRWFGERVWGSLIRRSASRLVALDTVARRQALEEGFEAGRIVVLHAGVDLTTFRPGLASELPRRHGVRGRCLLHIGRVEDGRGLERVVAAFAATVGRREDWSLVFAGVGAGRLRLRAQAEQLGIGARVHWIGVPRPEELPGLLGSATALVIASRDDDVASLKARRAMAAGVPVLASAVPRLMDLVEDGGSGLLVSNEDPGAWADALRTLASDPIRRERWGRRARELAEQRFAWPEIGTRFEALLLRAIQQQRADATELAPAVAGAEEASPLVGGGGEPAPRGG